MEDTIKITVTPEDAEKASAFNDNKNCLICQAVMRTYPKYAGKVVAGVTTIVIGNSLFGMPVDAATKIMNAYSSREDLSIDRTSPIVDESFEVEMRYKC